MEKKIFYIDIDINDKITGMNCIALVDNPAVEKDFLCFEKQEPVKLQFNKDEHIITGVVALADTPIYRNYNGYEYYVVFTKDVIKKLVYKYSKQGLFNSVNLQHDDNQPVNNAIMIESYIINKERGIVPEEFKDVPDGSWMATYYIDDDNLWNEIINGDKLNGFSLQGQFNLEDMIPEAFHKEETFDEWIKSYIE